MTYNSTSSIARWLAILIVSLVFVPSARAAEIPSVPSVTVAALDGLPGEVFQTAPPSAVPTSKILFDVPAPTLTDAQGYVYKHYDDGALIGVAFAAGAVTCLAGPSTGLFTCTVAFPAFAPGTHAMTLSASNAAGEGQASAPLSFKFEVTPGKILNLRIGL